MLGYAIGCVGISFDDFCVLTVEEFNAIAEAHHRQEQERSKDAWERMRLLASINIAPHTKKRIKATDLLKYPWDTPTSEAPSQREELTPEQRKERIALLMKNGW